MAEPPLSFADGGVIAAGIDGDLDELRELSRLVLQAAGSAEGSVISSASRNVKLDSGTQMILQVTGSPAAR